MNGFFSMSVTVSRDSILKSIQIDRFLVFAVLACLVGLAFRSSFYDMADAWWNTETHSHGLLVAPLGIWLLWNFRQTLRTSSIGSPILGLLLLLACSVFWVVGRTIEAKVVMNFSAVGMIVAVAMVVFSLRVVWQTRFAFIFLFFMVPFGEFLEPILMEQTANVTVNLLRLTGIPVYREGMQFRLPSGSWSVVEACSGLRYIIAALILASLFAHLRNMKVAVSIGFVFMAFIVAIIANWIRAYTVVLVGHYSQMRYGTGDDHVWYGWVFFGIVMFGVFSIGQRFGSTLKLGSSLVNGELTIRQKSHWSKIEYAGLAITIFMIFSTPYLSGRLATKSPIKPFFPVTVDLPLGAQIESSYYEPNFTNPVEKLSFRNGQGERSVESHFYYYAAQSVRHSKMVGNSHGILKTAELSAWKAIYFGRKQTINGQLTTEALIESGGAKRLVWSWYQAGRYQTASAYKASAYTVLNVLSGRGDHAVAIVLSTSLADGEDAARARLTEQYTASQALAAKGFSK
jgi:exosortase A